MQPDLHAANPPRAETAIRKRRNRDRDVRVADAILDLLVQYGVEVVFGIPGGSIAPIYDALLDRPQLRTIMMRHECNAVFAAAGYAQATGRLGVVFVTSGPGILNTMNGLGSAFVDNLPVLVLAGEASRAGFGRGAVQEGSAYALNVVGMAQHVTKLACEVPEGTQVPSMLARAMATAMSGKRGPVVLSLPLNVLGERIYPPRVSLQVGARFEIDSGSLTHVSKALTGAGRKVLFVGSGARFGSTPKLLVRLAEQLQLPVMTTPKGKGVFPESHNLSLGIFGMGGHRSSEEYLEKGVDVVLCLGTSLNEVATNGWSRSLQAKRSMIQVDIDGASIGRAYNIDIAIASPADAFLSSLLKILPERSGERIFGVEYEKSPELNRRGSHGRIAPPRALWELQQRLPADTIFTTDSGSNLFFAAHYLRIDHPDTYISMLGLGSMGTSLGAAIGAQIAHPDRTTVAICGDGGLAMCAGELSTAAQEHLPIIVVVLNDERYSMVEFGHRSVYGRSAAYPTGPFKVADVARACGAEVVTIEQPDQLLDYPFGRKPTNRPLVFDVGVDPSVHIPKNRRVKQVRSADKERV